MPSAALLLTLLLTAVFDFRQRRVPNWLVLASATLALGLLAVGVHPLGIGWAEAGLGAVTGFGVLLVFYALGLMGAGDVKFAGALGLWVGLTPLLPIWVLASLLAGAHAVLWLMLQRWPLFPRLAEALSGMPPARPAPSAGRQRQRHIPFAAYLAIATLIWLAWRPPLL